MQIVIDARELGLAEKWLNSGVTGARSAVRTAIVETIGFTQSEIKRQIAGRYDIEIDKARLNLRATNPPSVRGTTSGDIRGSVEISSARLPTMRFNVMPSTVPPQKGIPVAQRQAVSRVIVKGQANVAAPNRFIAKMKSGHIGVFMRKPDATHTTRPDGQSTALNISEEYMISPEEMLLSREIQPKLDANVRAYFTRRVNEGIKNIRLRK